MTIEPPQYEDAEDNEADEEVASLIALDAGKPSEPRIITTPPPKVTRKKMKYVKQREDQPKKKTPHWNPNGNPGAQELKYAHKEATARTMQRRRRANRTIIFVLFCSCYQLYCFYTAAQDLFHLDKTAPDYLL